MEKEKVIIVGAGITGLVLARQLPARFDVTLLEAKAVAGGRIQTITHKDFPIPIESGAEFIHGHLTHTLQLLKDAGIPFEAVEGKIYRKKNGKWEEPKEMIDGWNELMIKMKKLDTDIVFHDFLNKYFGEEKYTELCSHAIAFAEGFDLADTMKVSTKALYKEWSHTEEENFRIPAGYGALVNFLVQQNIEKGGRFIYNETAKKISWKKNEVSIETVAGKKYECNRLFITVPLGILQGQSPACSIKFSPGLPDHMKAAAQVGFGAVIKIALLFKEAFWKRDSGFVFSEEIVPTWWTQLPNEAPVLTGWVGGTQAASLSNESNKRILTKALASLSNIFDIPVEELEKKLKSSYVANWGNSAWSAGAYSYATPQTKAARQLLEIPVEDTIYFCGEGIYDGEAPGTVEASIAHAMETVKKIKP